MTNSRLNKVGVYVDMANIARNGGYGLRFDILREFACRENGQPIRLNTYVAYDEQRALIDNSYKEKTFNFYSSIRDFGFKVREKKVSWYMDEYGNKFGKANSDLDMAVDTLLQAENLDKVVMVTGDGDFIEVVKALQNKGCRVELVAFENISSQLKREVDFFMSGYLIPNLLPVMTESAQVSNSTFDNQNTSQANWGDSNSRVRGICYSYNHSKGYGFMRFLDHIDNALWVTDTRNSESPYSTAFVHESCLKEVTDLHLVPSRDYIFEFDLVDSEKGKQAKNIKLINNQGHSPTQGYKEETHHNKDDHTDIAL